MVSLHTYVLSIKAYNGLLDKYSRQSFRSFEYADLLQEINCIVVTSGQVLVDGQSVKACKIDLSCPSES